MRFSPFPLFTLANSSGPQHNRDCGGFPIFCSCTWTTFQRRPSPGRHSYSLQPPSYRQLLTMPPKTRAILVEYEVNARANALPPLATRAPRARNTRGRKRIEKESNRSWNQLASLQKDLFLNDIKAANVARDAVQRFARAAREAAEAAPLDAHGTIMAPAFEHGWEAIIKACMKAADAYKKLGEVEKILLERLSAFRQNLAQMPIHPDIPQYAAHEVQRVYQQ